MTPVLTFMLLFASADMNVELCTEVAQVVLEADGLSDQEKRNIIGRCFLVINNQK